MFSDVDGSNPFYGYIRCLACRGIVSGYSTSPPCVTGAPCFLWGSAVTRGQVSKMVSNAAGFSDAIPSMQQTFADVAYGSAFWVYIERLYAHGAISGYSGSPPCLAGQALCFLPNSPVTRSQLAKIAANAAGYAEVIPSGQQTFGDVPPSHPLWVYVERVHLHGVISGYSGDRGTINPCTGAGEVSGQLYFRPCLNTTRGQTAKITAQAFYPGCATPRR
jgi:hypothetical protein